MLFYIIAHLVTAKTFEEISTGPMDPFLYFPDGRASNLAKMNGSGSKQSVGFICDVIHCNGTFYDEHVYMEHVRHVHSHCINIISDEKCQVVQIKDTSRAVPTQTGPRPASKRKIWTVLRIRCNQGQCQQSSASYFATRALYNKHNADVHSSKVAETDSINNQRKNTKATEDPKTADDTSTNYNEEAEETKEYEESDQIASDGSGRKSPVKYAPNSGKKQSENRDSAMSVEAHQHRHEDKSTDKNSSPTRPKKSVINKPGKDKEEKAEESVVQSTVSSPNSPRSINAEDPDSASPSEDDEPIVKRRKSDEERLKSMMSKSSYTTLLKDLHSLKKGQPKTSTPIKVSPMKVSPARVSPGRGSPARVSPRKKEAGKKGNECDVCREKFGASVPQCLCNKVDIHKCEAKVELKALNTSVVSKL